MSVAAAWFQTQIWMVCLAAPELMYVEELSCA
jgi:hypothetical protein